MPTTRSGCGGLSLLGSFFSTASRTVRITSKLGRTPAGETSGLGFTASSVHEAYTSSEAARATSRARMGAAASLSSTTRCNDLPVIGSSTFSRTSCFSQEMLTRVMSLAGSSPSLTSSAPSSMPTMRRTSEIATPRHG